MAIPLTRRHIIRSASVAAIAGTGFLTTEFSRSRSIDLVSSPLLRAAGGGTRNPLVQPFTPESIWNHPIGSGAKYVAAGLERTPAQYAELPGSDPMRLCLTPTAPATNIVYSSAGWSGRNRCGGTGSQVLARVPMPANYVVPSSNKNECAAFLAADGHTIIQVQPLARCSAGSTATSIIRFRDEDLYGDGIGGAHGGSKLSAIGGCLRLGEMRRGGRGPAHALNVTIATGRYLYRARTEAETFRWPALTSDSGAIGYYGAATNNRNFAMRMGVLLALPPASTLPTSLRTDPGRQLAWTLQNYGAYVTDGTGADFLISTEEGQAGSFLSQFRADWGFAFNQRANQNTPWVQDIGDILLALCAVDNNSAGSVGGGGTPRTAMAAALA